MLFGINKLLMGFITLTIFYKNIYFLISYTTFKVNIVWSYLVC